MLLEVETAIINRLSQHLSGVKVLPFPETPDEFGKPAIGSQLFVGFRGEQLETPSQIVPGGLVTQARILEYDLIYRLKDLRTHTGAYSVMGQVRDLLTGFLPVPKTKGMYQVRGGFSDLNQGIWVYVQTFACPGFYQSKRQV